MVKGAIEGIQNKEVEDKPLNSKRSKGACVAFPVVGFRRLSLRTSAALQDKRLAEIYWKRGNDKIRRFTCFVGCDNGPSKTGKFEHTHWWTFGFGVINAIRAM